MTTSNFTVTGEKELTRRLTAIGKAPREILNQVGRVAVREAKSIHRPHRKTSNLEHTIRVGAITDTYVEVRAGGQRNVGYAAVVEFGSRAHVIVPRTATVLAWGGARTLGGRLRKGSRPTNFARRVNHPGTKPYPYLIPGVEKALKLVGLDDLVRRWNGAA